jgi:hypothetical protein
MQKSVSLSTAEAEYFGAMMAARDLIFGGRSISMPKALISAYLNLDHVRSVKWSSEFSGADGRTDEQHIITPATRS